MKYLQFENIELERSFLTENMDVIPSGDTFVSLWELLIKCEICVINHHIIHLVDKTNDQDFVISYDLSSKTCEIKSKYVKNVTYETPLIKFILENHFHFQVGSIYIAYESHFGTILYSSFMIQ